jgi:hypothetical protein
MMICDLVAQLTFKRSGIMHLVWPRCLFEAELLVFIKINGAATYERENTKRILPAKQLVVN